MTWLETQVRNTSLRQLAACLAIIAAAIGLLAFNQRYLTNYFTGIYDIPREELLATANPEDLLRYWVKTKPDEVIDTGIDIITVRKSKYGVERSREVTGHYFIGKYGTRYLLIKAPNQSLSEVHALDGGLVAPAAGMIDRLVSNNPRVPNLRERFLPVMLDAGDFEFDAQALLWLSGLASALALGWALFAGYRASKPTGHSTIQALLKAPGADLNRASASIGADVSGRRTAKLKNGVQLTTTHLVQNGALKFKLLPLSDLLWAHPQVTKKKIYGIIPAGKTHAAIFKFSNTTMKVGGSEPQTTAVMQHLSQVAPWTLLGFSDDLEKAYKRQRPQLIAAVAERRADVLRHWSAQAGPAN